MELPVIRAVDYHVAGEPLRIVLGRQAVEGATMAQKAANGALSLRGQRDFLVTEPRGHAEMFGAFLTDPVGVDSAFGALFFDASAGSGFKGACGHGSIAVAVAAFDHGWVKGREGWNDISLDVPLGTVHLSVEIVEGRPMRVRYRHVPSRLLATDVRLATAQGDVRLDLVHAGALVAFLDAAAIGLSPSRATLPRLRALYAAIRDAAEAGALTHPVTGAPCTPELVLFTADREAGENSLHYDVAALFGPGSLDRSPCGTGTSARMAQLVGRGRLDEAGRIVATSIIGSRFEGGTNGTVDLEGVTHVLPVVTGSAHMTGRHEFVRDPADGLANGFRYEADG
jgi:proline racemase